MRVKLKAIQPFKILIEFLFFIFVFNFVRVIDLPFYVMSLNNENELEINFTDVCR